MGWWHRRPPSSFREHRLRKQLKSSSNRNSRHFRELHQPKIRVRVQRVPWVIFMPWLIGLFWMSAFDPAVL
jgi:hypothetical protein